MIHFEEMQNLLSASGGPLAHNSCIFMRLNRKKNGTFPMVMAEHQDLGGSLTWWRCQWGTSILKVKTGRYTKSPATAVGCRDGGRRS